MPHWILAGDRVLQSVRLARTGRLAVVLVMLDVRLLKAGLRVVTPTFDPRPDPILSIVRDHGKALDAKAIRAKTMAETKAEAKADASAATLLQKASRAVIGLRRYLWSLS